MIKPVTEKHKEAFNKAANHPLQTWEWGEFRKKTGNKIVRLARYKNNKLTDAIQLTLHSIPGTSFKVGAFLKGPKPTKEIIEELKKLGKKENLIFIKLEPNYVINSKVKAQKSKPQLKTQRLIRVLKNSGCVPGKTLFTPTSFWIDLTPPEEELFKSFHHKTRYNIRLAQRKGVEIVEDSSKKAFERYIQLTRETVERQGFYAHTEKYHRLMWEYLHQSPVTNHPPGQAPPQGGSSPGGSPSRAGGRPPIARLLTARYKGEIITTWIVFVWHNFLYYPYGASSEKYKNVMANNLIMWEAIRYGKRLGLKAFDLWGREPGKGFTRFKEGYNPEVVQFLGTWDLVISPFYYPYRVLETIRWGILRAKSSLPLAKSTF